MKIALGADHGGFILKDSIRKWLEESGHQVMDMGTFSAESVDYPDFAVKVALAVANGEASRGIMIDGAGVGSAMACNKVPGIRAACCNELQTAINSVQHNDANLLTMGSGIIGTAVAKRIVESWLATTFEGGRHQGRVDKIMSLEASWRGVISAERIRTVVEKVVRAVLGTSETGSLSPSGPKNGLITEEVARNVKGRCLKVKKGTIITPAARDVLAGRDITVSIE